MKNLHLIIIHLKQKKLLSQSGEMMANVIGNNLNSTSTETEIELNFALVKIKHKVKRTKDNNKKS